MSFNDYFGIRHRRFRYQLEAMLADAEERVTINRRSGVGCSPLCEGRASGGAPNWLSDEFNAALFKQGVKRMFC